MFFNRFHFLGVACSDLVPVDILQPTLDLGRLPFLLCAHSIKSDDVIRRWLFMTTITSTVCLYLAGFLSVFVSIFFVLRVSLHFVRFLFFIYFILPHWVFNQ